MADFDLDDELLALAGDVDGTPDAIGSPDEAARSHSATPPKDTIEIKSSAPPEDIRGGIAAKAKSTTARKTKRSRRKDESEDEGEA
jgi:hypothetical protein